MAEKYVLTAFILTTLGVSWGSTKLCQPCRWDTPVYSSQRDGTVYLIAQYDELYRTNPVTQGSNYAKTFFLPDCDALIIGLSLELEGSCKIDITTSNSQSGMPPLHFTVTPLDLEIRKRVCIGFGGNTSAPNSLMKNSHQTKLLVNVTSNVSGGRCSVAPTHQAALPLAMVLNLNYTDGCTRPAAKTPLQIQPCSQTHFPTPGRIAVGGTGPTMFPPPTNRMGTGYTDYFTDGTGMIASRNGKGSMKSVTTPTEKQPKQSDSSLPTAVGTVIGLGSVCFMSALLYVLWRRYSTQVPRGDTVERQNVPLPRRPSTPDNFDRTATLYSAVGQGHEKVQSNVQNASTEPTVSMPPESAVYATVLDEPTGTPCQRVGQRSHATSPTPLETRDQEEWHNAPSIATDVYALPQKRDKENQYTKVTR